MPSKFIFFFLLVAYITCKKKAIFETVFVDAALILAEELEKRDYEIIKPSFDLETVGRSTWNLQNFDFKWTWNPSEAASMKWSQEHVILNQFSGVRELTEKHHLTRNLNRAQKSGTFEWHLDNWFPRTFVMDCNQNLEEQIFPLTQEFSDSCDRGLEVSQPELGNQNVWIVKAASLTGGAGAALFSNLEDIHHHLQVDCAQNRSYVVQKYSENPLLIRNLKFDIRFWVLVVSMNPRIVFALDDFYLRFGLHPFGLNNLSDAGTHLTNHEILRELVDVETLDIPYAQWTSKQFYRWTKETGNEEQWKASKKKIDQILVNTIQAWDSQYHRNNSFQLLGFDIMLDEQWNPYLIEVNLNPSTHLRTPIVKKHHPKGLRDMIKVVIDERDHWSRCDFEEYSMKVGKWKLLLREKETEEECLKKIEENTKRQQVEMDRQIEVLKHLFKEKKKQKQEENTGK